MQRRDVFGLAVGLFVGPLGAQGLNSPMPGVQPTHPLNGIPQGQGAGIHSPLSPFKPLPERRDVLPWSVLTDIDKRIVNRRVQPIFPPRFERWTRCRSACSGLAGPMGAQALS